LNLHHKSLSQRQKTPLRKTSFACRVEILASLSFDDHRGIIGGGRVVLEWRVERVVVLRRRGGGVSPIPVLKRNEIVKHYRYLSTWSARRQTFR